VTGLPPNQRVALSVFSRDWSGLVGDRATAVVTTPHQAGSALTTSVTPRAIVYGTRATIAGRLTRTSDGAPIAGASIAVSAAGEPPRAVGTARTDADGRYSFAQAPAGTTYYRLSYAGDAEHGPAQAAPRLSVAPRVSERLDHPAARAGTPVHLTALLSPASTGASVQTYLQGVCGGLACTLGPHRTGPDARVVYTITAPARGTSRRYRVLVAGYDVNAFGAWVTVTGT
jgi:hypothetical protein